MCRDHKMATLCKQTKKKGQKSFKGPKKKINENVGGSGTEAIRQCSLC